MLKLGLARILAGLLFSLAASILIVFFVSLGYDVSGFTDLGTTETYKIIFAVLLNPLTAINLGHWDVIAAIAVGGLLGGLISKSPTSGLLVGLLSFVAIFLLFLGLSLGFTNFSGWLTWVETNASNIALDLLLCAAIFAGTASIGGKLTAEKE